MPQGLNKVMVIGHVGRDPEMRYTATGKPVTHFPVGTTRTWVTPDGERREATEWFHVVAWGSLAEICCRYLRKGSRVYVEGRLQTRSWQDAQGRPHRRTELVATEMLLLDTEHGRDVPTLPEEPEEDDLSF